MILISHDLDFLDAVTTHMMGIHRQKLTRSTVKAPICFRSIAKEEEIHELTRQNIEKKRAHMQAYIDRFGAKATKAAQAQSRRKMIEQASLPRKVKKSPPPRF